ncbi:VOC family protein [Streptomyces sp. ODS05-4]|uniref:VOC family protein n=1 Tax=Streptomyces sp. ODS05-4 TaxID=2944939 RepID=UPI0021096C7C|nr:VOC family protein [Streptomyces sp. ODS05-4]
MLQFDHLVLFVKSERDASAAVTVLEDAGYCAGSSNKHPGQGTANRRVFFDNAYLEFLFPTNLHVVASPAIARTGIAQRFRYGCPFGVGLREMSDGNLPFPTWEFGPHYLPDSARIRMASCSSDAWQPLLFTISFEARPDHDAREPLEHAAGRTSIGEALITSPGMNSSNPAMVAVSRLAPLTFSDGARPACEVVLELARSRGVVDLHPFVPVRLHR